MSSTNCISRLPQVLQELLVLTPLDSIHGQSIQLPDTLKYLRTLRRRIPALETIPLPVSRQVVRIAEPGAPVAEITGDDKHRCRIREVGSEDRAVGLLGCGAGAADEDGDQRRILGCRGECLGEHFVDVREVHLEAVLVLVCVGGHTVELTRLNELLHDGSIDREIPKGGGIVGVF